MAYGENVVITGTLTDSEGNILYNTNLKATLNGKTISVKTNSKGMFKITSKATTIGNSKVTVTFTENAYYNTAKTEATTQ